MSDDLELGRSVAILLRREESPLPEGLRAAVLASTAHTVQGRGGRMWPWTLTPPRMRSVLVAAALAALAAALVLALVASQPSPDPVVAPGSILFTDADGLHIASEGGAEAVRLGDVPSGCCLADGRWRFAPDGHHLAYWDTLGLDGPAQRELLRIETVDGRVTGSYTTTPEAQFAWAPDGQRLAVVSYPPPSASADRPLGDHVILGLDGAVLGTVDLPQGFLLSSYWGQAAMSWSPDGRLIAVPGCIQPCYYKDDTGFSDGRGRRFGLPLADRRWYPGDLARMGTGL